MKAVIREFIEVNDEVKMLWGVTEDKKLLLLHCGTKQIDKEKKEKLLEDENLSEFSPLEVKILEANPAPERFPGQTIRGSLSILLKYAGHTIVENDKGKLVIFVLKEDNFKAEVSLYYQFYKGTETFESYCIVKNSGSEKIGLQEISSFMLNGIEEDTVSPYRDQFDFLVLNNGWQKELAVKRYFPEDLGLSLSQPGRRVNSSKVIEFVNVGTWSSKRYIPCFYIEKLKSKESLAIQILNNGSWQLQAGEHDGHVYVNAGGPTETFGDFFMWLEPGRGFESVHASVTVTEGTAEEAAVALTKYRRAIRRVNDDNKKLPVIFNDYMNCLWGNPTTEAELPLIEAARDCGAEVFCIDCGWYADGYWWDEVGDWMPSSKRFPEGLDYLLKKIKDAGMIPGLWLEIESVGINSPVYKRVPHDWFFTRHGKNIMEKSRLQLDFRNPEVRAFADEVIKRLVEEYGVGYIKMDYNLDPGTGTTINADSAGQGLLEHNRAYLKWLDGVFKKYPDLIIENCGSGGLRMDYAMLSRLSIQSTSDMEDYRTYSTITVNSPLALTPEQAAVWSYPLMEGTEEETVTNMVNTIFLRIHQSGHLAKISPARKAMVKEGIDYYKSIREDRAEALPFWPTGLCTYETPWVSLGLKGKEKTYVSVWRRDSDEATKTISLPECIGKDITLSYPSKETEPHPSGLDWNKATGILKVTLPKKFTARIYEFK